MFRKWQYFGAQCETESMTVSVAICVSVCMIAMCKQELGCFQFKLHTWTKSAKFQAQNDADS